ncbi:hypothetical protein H5U41_11565 [Mycolicibacterium holsaticum DSM 44478 = JCM 12374]|nr:hypothetical protein K3U96_15265 [Mycolicibacterium holsaticum DSM 44478 = JCM 12374]UNC12406.1 hypothetical protein H5U41_11565 [Mycolicibacterium holsaticum DSM 44478 = JCM 12374]
MRIVKVELPDESLKTRRILARRHGNQYPVIVYFSRPADAFERVALEDELDIKFDEDDPMCALHLATTLEMFENEIEGINSSIDNAVANAHTDREAAEKEDARLNALADKLTRDLQSSFREG